MYFFQKKVVRGDYSMCFTQYFRRIPATHELQAFDSTPEGPETPLASGRFSASKADAGCPAPFPHCGKEIL
jgi:hypothetical protein